MKNFIYEEKNFLKLFQNYRNISLPDNIKHVIGCSLEFDKNGVLSMQLYSLFNNKSLMYVRGDFPIGKFDFNGGTIQFIVCEDKFDVMQLFKLITNSDMIKALDIKPGETVAIFTEFEFELYVPEDIDYLELDENTFCISSTLRFFNNLSLQRAAENCELPKIKLKGLDKNELYTLSILNTGFYVFYAIRNAAALAHLGREVLRARAILNQLIIDNASVSKNISDLECDWQLAQKIFKFAKCIKQGEPTLAKVLRNIATLLGYLDVEFFAKLRREIKAKRKKINR